MLRLAADENLNNAIVRGIMRRNPAIDIVQIHDVGLAGADDPAVLEWAAQNGRVLFTHDVTTMTCYALDRVRRGQSMPGLFEVGRDVPLGSAIENILLVAKCSRDGEWQGQVRYLPLR